MNRFVIALFFSLLFESCSNHHTEISGIITHIPKAKTSIKVYLYSAPHQYNWLDGEKTKLDSCLTGEDGFYSFKNILAEDGLFFDLRDSGQTFVRNFYILSGEKLRFDFDYGVSPPGLLGTARAGKYNHFIEEFSDSFYRDPGVKQYYYVGSNFLLAPDYAKYIDQRHEGELEFLQRHLNKKNSDPVFMNYILNEINFQWANDKIAFLWKKWVRDEEVSLDSNYYNFTQQLKVCDPNALNSPAYIRFLQLYIREKHRQLPDSVQLSEAAFKLKVKIAMNEFSGLPLKVALLHVLKEEMGNCFSLGKKDSVQIKKVSEIAHYFDSLTSDTSFSWYFDQQYRNE